MPSLTILKVLLHELTSRERQPRVPEPDLVMDNPEHVDAFAQSGAADQVMAPIYLYNAAHVSDIIRPGDLVIDLGCGPATQLSLIARLNPDVRFVGVDLSEPMLERGHGHLQEVGIGNVEMQLGDITDLASFESHSIDAVISTLALHQLPDADALHRTLHAAKRVLKDGGGLYLLDFGRLKSLKSIDALTREVAPRQSELMTLDYWHSLRAAFSLEDLTSATSVLAGSGKLHSTFLAPLLVAFKSVARRSPPAELRERYKRLCDDHLNGQESDFNDLVRFFRLSGLRSALL